MNTDKEDIDLGPTCLYLDSSVFIRVNARFLLYTRGASMSRVLVTETLSPEGLAVLQGCCEVDVRLKLEPAKLMEILPAYDALVVRSATQVTAEVLAAGTRLQGVGRAGTGGDNIDVDAATRRGIVVVNAPTSNTIAVAEHTVAMMLALARHICDANAGLHEGRWEKQRLMGTELRGKTLGLVGLGRVGQAVASRARAMEMRVMPMIHSCLRSAPGR